MEFKHHRKDSNTHNLFSSQNDLKEEIKKQISYQFYKRKGHYKAECHKSKAQLNNKNKQKGKTFDSCMIWISFI